MKDKLDKEFQAPPVLVVKGFGKGKKKKNEKGRFDTELNNYGQISKDKTKYIPNIVIWTLRILVFGVTY